MSRPRKALILFGACCVVMAGLGHWSQAEAKTLPIEAQAVADVHVWQRFAYEQAMGLAVIEQTAYDLQVQVDTFIKDVWYQEQLAREEAERQAVAAAAEAARQRAAQPQPAPRPLQSGGGGGGGSCYGGVVPDYIVTRESGGNPNAVNPSSGAFGCYQFMPSTWSSSCSDLSRDVAGQKECASRISNGGSNLQPWSTG